MRFYHRLILCLYIFPITAFAQQKAGTTDITGLWKGTLYNDTTQTFYKYEIGISEDKGQLSGFSHTWFILDDKQYYGIKKVKIKRVDGKIIIEDAGLIANNYPVAPAKGVKQLNVLELNTEDSIMTLTGPFTTNRIKEYHSLTGSVRLERKNDYWQSALLPHLQELNLAKNLSFVEDEISLTKRYLEFQVQQEAVQPEGNSIVVSKVKKTAVRNELIAASKKGLEETPTASNLPVRIIAEEQTGVADRTITKSANASPGSGSAVKTLVTGKELTPEKLFVNKADSIYLIKLPAKTVKPVIAKSADNPVTDTSAFVKTNKPIVKSIEAATPVNIIAAPGKAVNVITPITSQNSKAAAFNVYNRITTVQQTVNFQSDSLQLSLYDNGEVDGDTVSVVMNGDIIIAKQRLSTNAVRKTLYIPKDVDTIQLIMYAENLGTIAPNTGLLVVKDGKDLYEIRFSGDLQKNAAIIFKRKKIIP